MMDEDGGVEPIGISQAEPSRVEHFCSFCGKSQNDAQKLIAGPNAVMICNECVVICCDILRESGMMLGGPPRPIARFSLPDLEARLIGFLTRHGRSRKLSFGMIGELFDALDMEVDIKVAPRDNTPSPTTRTADTPEGGET